MFDYNFNMPLEVYYSNLFDTIHDTMNDREVLQVAIETLKIATARLDNDLNNKKIKKEYQKLGYIIRELEQIEEEYV